MSGQPWMPVQLALVCLCDGDLSNEIKMITGKMIDEASGECGGFICLYHRGDLSRAMELACFFVW